LKRLRTLARTPLFWAITLWGNACVLGGAALFHHFESGVNPHVGGFIDSLGWSVGVATTVGGPLGPVTLQGKVLAIVMMMGGALFLWSYMALFVGALVEPELERIERDVSGLRTARRREK
jgi:hypothetical protein